MIGLSAMTDSRSTALFPVLLVLLIGCSVAPEKGRADENGLAMQFVQALIDLRLQPYSLERSRNASEALRNIITDESLVGDRALALLAGRYLGESVEPECEILRRGQRMISLLRELEPEGERLPLAASPIYTRGLLIELIEDGVFCE